MVVGGQYRCSLMGVFLFRVFGAAVDVIFRGKVRSDEQRCIWREEVVVRSKAVAEEKVAIEVNLVTWQFTNMDLLECSWRKPPSFCCRRQHF